MGADKQEKSKQKPVKSLFGDGVKSGTGLSFDWGMVDAERLRKLIELVTGRGGAIRFGYSRDGNAGSLGIYYGQQRDTVYFRPGQDMEDGFSLIERTFEALPYSGGKSPDQ